MLRSVKWDYNDVLVYDGNQWCYEDIISEENINYISAPFVFRDKLIIPVCLGDYLKVKDLSSSENICYAFDGYQTERINIDYDNMIDVVVRDTTLFLLIEDNKLYFITKTSDLCSWEYNLIPPIVKDPICIEVKDDCYFIGTERGDIYVSIGSKLIRD
jgi:hypothetical protein